VLDNSFAGSILAGRQHCRVRSAKKAIKKQGNQLGNSGQRSEKEDKAQNILLKSHIV
jgi:hypothetical protein